MIMALIYRNVGRKKTNELLLLGEQVSRRRRRSGSGSSTARARRRSSTPPWKELGANVWRRDRLVPSTPAGKDAMYRQQDMALADDLDYLPSPSSRSRSPPRTSSEGVKAFFERL